MKTVYRNLIVIGFFVLFAFAGAQRVDPFDFFVADIRIMQAREVQNELKIGAQQRTRMNTLAEAHRKEVDAVQKSLGSNPTKAQQDAAEKRLVEALRKLKEGVMAILTPAQGKRLREITLQGYGMAALVDERVAKRVGMTDAQIKQVREALQAGNQRSVKLQQDATRPIAKQYEGKEPRDQKQAEEWQKDVQSKLQAAGRRIQPDLLRVQRETEARVRAILTPKQRDAFSALMGRPFRPQPAQKSD